VNDTAAAQPTDIGDVALPEVLVTLPHLKRKDGQPVTVLVCGIVETRLLQILKVLPGLTPDNLQEKIATMTEDEIVATFEAIAPQIIVEGCLSPRFDHAGIEGRALPLRVLRVEDRGELLIGVLRASGFISKEAEALSFRDGDGAGREGSGGTVVTGTGNGEAASGASGIPDGSAVPGGGRPVDVGAS